jgi:hypothetical protein
MKNQGELFTKALTDILEKQDKNGHSRRHRYNSEQKSNAASHRAEQAETQRNRPFTPLTLAL